MFTFFIEKVGLIEAIDKYYHIEMYYGNNTVFTEEPPKAHIDVLPSVKLKVFRLKNKPNDFNDKFDKYCKTAMNFPFDYGKWWQLFLNAIFGTTKFSKGKDNLTKDVCAENVTRFYKESIGVLCSIYDPDSSIPADVNEYCSAHPELFDLIFDVQ
jgi:hypothetical protein